jgi:MraZ protein
VAAGFFGRYEHSLDVKGRVILPVRFRPTFGPQAYLSQYQDRCLALWPTDEFEKQMAEMTLLQEQGDPERNLARIWAAGLAEVDIDRQGRLAIPSHLREFARLDSAVLVVGVLNRVELWSPAEWDVRVEPATDQYTKDGAGAAVAPPVTPS